MRRKPMRINNDFIIVGVDAGYGNMKTANTIFPTVLATMNIKPYFDGDIMHYNKSMLSENK